MFLVDLLCRNRITGALPAAWYTLNLLTYLDASFNTYTLFNSSSIRTAGGISGPIPTTWFTLAQLAHFALESNAMTGTLPPYMSSMTALSALRFSRNVFTGPVRAWCNWGSTRVQ